MIAIFSRAEEFACHRQSPAIAIHTPTVSIDNNGNNYGKRNRTAANISR